ncbi:MAG TPA: low specificity L-threonine aldolase [Rhizomicrobium sp.]|jgi:threonine aldolase|nr:low specificity L-threonine aldolase [Rhizomicrobium sp.]
MNFASDNTCGAAPEMIEALRIANGGAVPSYGEDGLSARLKAELARLFEHDVAVYPVITGTAANALALSTLVPPHGAIFCHREAHIATDECGAPELFTQGATLVTLAGLHGKISPDALEQATSRFVRGSVHHAQPAAASITQVSEMGTCYRHDEVRAIAEIARRHGMKLHLDGARLANAIAFLGCTPAEATWKAGVDTVSFGMSKNGALAAEAVVFFHPEEVRDFEFRRKRFGHLISKMRFVAAQLLCALENDRWLHWARSANARARLLAGILRDIADVEVVHPVDANLVFATLPESLILKLRSAGAKFYDWSPPERGRRLVRFVTSFATSQSEIEQLRAACA